MASFNKVILMGNLTRDPELRFTPKGTAVARLGLAVNRTWKTETGETKEDVLFIDVEAFSRQAETVEPMKKVGEQPLLAGSGAGWNAGGMHHIDARPQPEGGWIAAVDGWAHGGSDQ